MSMKDFHGAMTLEKVLLGLGVLGIGAVVYNSMTSSDSSIPRPVNNAPEWRTKFVAPYNWGVPFAPTTGVVWPVRGGPRVISYRDINGKGASGTSFGAARSPKEGEPSGRRHAAIDVITSYVDKANAIVATEDGVVKAITRNGPYVSLDAIQIDHAKLSVQYCEIHALAALKAGAIVKAGDVIGYSARNGDGRAMLHFETWELGFAPKAYYTMWIGTPQKGLLDPTEYLLALGVRDPLKRA